MTKIKGKAIFWLTKVTVRAYCLFFLKLRVRGLEHIPRKTGGIIVANHRSMLDGFLLYSLMEGIIRPFIKGDYFKNSMLSWYLTGGGGIPVDNGQLLPSALREADHTLRGGGLILLFPEGEVNTKPGLLPFKSSFMRLSLKYKVPIIPVTIMGTEKALPDGKFFPRPSAISVVIKDPLHFHCPIGRKDLIESCVHKVRNRIMEGIKDFPEEVEKKKESIA